MTDSVGERVPSVLLQAGRPVRRFLEEVLPPLSSSWWAEFVVAKLSFQQQRAARRCQVSLRRLRHRSPDLRGAEDGRWFRRPCPRTT